MKLLPTAKLLLIVTALLLKHYAGQAQHIWTAGSGITNVWSEPLNWSPGYPPTSIDAVVFDNFNGITNAPGVVNNVMDFSTSVNTLSYVAMADLGNHHTTQIPTGTSLSVVGTSGIILNVGTGADSGGETLVRATLTGGGNLVVGNPASPAGTIQIMQASGTSGSHTAILDLSGLNSFNAGVSLVSIGDGGNVSRRTGTIILAKTNVIRATSTAALGAFVICDNSGTGGNGGGTSEVYLGQENTINTDFLRIAGRRGSVGNMLFQAGLINPTLKLRGADTVGRMGTLSLGDNRDNSTSTSCTGTLEARAATVDILVNNMLLGYEGTGAAGIGIANIDAGTLDVVTMHLGSQQVNQTAGANALATGTLNIYGTATVVIGTLNIGGDRGSALGTGTGVLNIGGGNVRVAGNIIENNAVGGEGSSTINMTNGLLSVGGTVRVDSLNITNASLTLTISPAINSANPACLVTNLNFASPVTLNVSGGGFTVGQYPLLFCTNGIGGDGYAALTLGTLPARTQGYLSNNIANNSIDIVITNVSAARWEGNVNSNWDTNTANWKDTGNNAATTYIQNTIPGDTVFFNDAATGTKNVVLTTNLAPAVMVVSNTTTPYIFSGPGRLTGPAPLTKSGSGTLVISNTGLNDFSGTVALNGGVLQLGQAPDRLPSNLNLILPDTTGVLLDLGVDQTLNTLSGGGTTGGNVNVAAGTLTTKGTGNYFGNISGSGAFRKTTAGTTQTLGGSNSYSGGTVLTGGTIQLINSAGSGLGVGPLTMSSGTSLLVGNGGLAGLAASVIITNNGTITFNATNDTALGGIHGSGAVVKNNTNNITIVGAGTYLGATTIAEGGVRIQDSTGLGDVAGGTAIHNAATAHLELLGDITVAENFAISMKPGAAGLSPHFVNVSGTNSLIGTITGGSGGSYWSFRSDAGKMIVNGTFINSGSLAGRALRLFGTSEGEWHSSFPEGRVRKEQSGTWSMYNVHTYSGDTVVYGGKLLLTGAAAILSLATVTVGDASADSPCTFGGSGSVSGPVLVNPNGILAPGDAIGTMTILNTLTLQLGSTTLIDVNTDTLEHDSVTGLTSVTYGGTLVINPSGLGTAVTNGASAQLFSATSYGGAFDAIVPPVPGPGLSWDTSQLTVDGTLRITSGPNTTPTNLTFAVTGGGTALDISWPGTHTGWRLEVQTNNLSTGLSTNWFTRPGSTGTNQLTLPFDSFNGSVFYRMVYP